MTAPFGILVLCTANVCRSPLAASLLRGSLAGLGEQVVVTSAGVHAQQGWPMCAQAARLAGLDPDQHESSAAVPAELADAGLVLTADRLQRDWAVEEFPACAIRTFTLREAARLATQVVDRESTGTAVVSPRLPSDRAARLAWLVVEMDLARRQRNPEHDSHDDILDGHRRADHSPTLNQVAHESQVLAQALLACCAMPT